MTQDSPDSQTPQQDEDQRPEKEGAFDEAARENIVPHTVLAAFIRIARHHGVDLSLPTLLQRFAVRESEISDTLLLRIGKEYGFRIQEKKGWTWRMSR